MTIYELEKKVIQWAEDRNLIKGSTPETQKMKLIEEFGELSGDLLRNRDIKDSIGDMIVVCIILNQQTNKTELFDGDPLRFSIDDLLLSILFDNYNRVIRILKGKANLQQCLSIAYNEIKDRKGIMKDGVFIKESDI